MCKKCEFVNFVNDQLETDKLKMEFILQNTLSKHQCTESRKIDKHRILEKPGKQKDEFRGNGLETE